MVKRFFFIGLLLLGTAALLFTEGSLTMDLSVYNTVMRTRNILDEESYWGMSTAGAASMAFKSSGNRNVKAEVSYDFIFPEMSESGMVFPLITLKKAYVKSRFPLFRLTIGKTRLGWGDGFVFNSGDVIFGSTSLDVDLTASEIRSKTDWLTAVNIPLGRFSFLEGVVVTPPANFVERYPIGPGPLENVSAGLRLYTKAGGIKIEAGYMFRGDLEEKMHRPYLGFQGNLGADWYLAASAALPGEANSSVSDMEEAFEDSFNISAGLFHLQKVSREASLTFRFETLVMPYLEWEEQTPSVIEDKPDYALFCYPEIVFVPSESLSFSLRSIVSPLDFSAMLMTGGSWNIFEGFYITGNGIVALGEESDTYSFDKAEALWDITGDSLDGIAVSIGVNYIY